MRHGYADLLTRPRSWPGLESNRRIRGPPATSVEHSKVKAVSRAGIVRRRRRSTIGLEQAGIDHAGLVEIDARACSTLRQNPPKWNVIQQDVSVFDASPFAGVDIVSAGLPCPPFSVAGKQLGGSDERNLFPSNDQESSTEFGPAPSWLKMSEGWRAALSKVSPGKAGGFSL